MSVYLFVAGIFCGLTYKEFGGDPFWQRIAVAACVGAAWPIFAVVILWDFIAHLKYHP